MNKTTLYINKSILSNYRYYILFTFITYRIWNCNFILNFIPIINFNQGSFKRSRRKVKIHITNWYILFNRTFHNIGKFIPSSTYIRALIWHIEGFFTTIGNIEQIIIYSRWIVRSELNCSQACASTKGTFTNSIKI